MPGGSHLLHCDACRGEEVDLVLGGVPVGDDGVEGRDGDDEGQCGAGELGALGDGDDAAGGGDGGALDGGVVQVVGGQAVRGVQSAAADDRGVEA